MPKARVLHIKRNILACCCKKIDNIIYEYTYTHKYERFGSFLCLSSVQTFLYFMWIYFERFDERMRQRITRIFHYEHRLKRHVTTYTNVNFFTVKELLAYEVFYGFINNAYLPVNAHNMEIKHGRCQTLSIGENLGAMFFSYRARIFHYSRTIKMIRVKYVAHVLKIFT